MEHIKNLLRLIARNWFKIVSTVVLTIAFVIMMFPLNEVSDLVTTQVYKGTGSQVYLQFEELELGFLPSPGLAMGQISLEVAPLPPLLLRRLEVKPSLLGLLLQRIDAEATAEGLFRGDVKASVKPGRKMENGAATQAVQLQATNINLSDASKFAGLPVQFRGKLGLNLDGIIDPSFSNQPDITLDLQTSAFELMPTTINSPMGPVAVPEIKLGRLNLKGRLSAGQFLIEDGKFGQEGDEVSGTVKGRMGLELRLLGNGSVVPVATNYEFNIDMGAKKSFEDRAQLLLILIQNHRQPEADGGRYRFTLTGNAQTQQFNFTNAR